MPKTTLLTRAFAGIAAGAVLALGVPFAASAHVTVNPDQAEAGGWTYATFRVPTESDTASTTKVVVHLPTDTPFTSVSYQPTPGWTGQVTEEKLPEPVEVSGNTITEAPTTITFTATGDGIAPGQFQAFVVALGPVPDTGHVVMPATQTYSDGKVVEWKATPEEMEKDDTLEPAPVLWINDAPPSSDHHATDDATVTPADAASPATGDGLPLGLSISALVLAVAGVLLGAFAVGRTRKAKR
ncbi:YcnI family protein [Microbacterium sp. KUDC0406]|uniref:YcnI family copper-binding membrane protein n=1 Tax=Microbacterium sp. KUDC0406 TaxID=2909588 RepID=UPI001F35F7EF|nr:YcnI family protein [Microbacterium sp. KUDC0406]UJP09710.1 YcnI family protein [Microbacterium sp. KUDC0406]